MSESNRDAVVKVLETERLLLRYITTEDAPFMLALLNEPAFIKNIADRGVRTIEDAERYIESSPVASYQQNGFGMYAVELKESGTPIGVCGLVKRDALDDIDIGYAFLEPFWGKGYASEAATAVMDYAHNVLGIRRVVGIVSPDNLGSIRVLEKLGLRFDRMFHLPGYEEPGKLFVPATEPD